MKEHPVEIRLKNKLQAKGFEVLKLVTPGNTDSMDRMILRPRYAPGPPVFVEVKRPGEEPRKSQAWTRDDWRKRGCDVREYVDTYEKVDALAEALIKETGVA